MLRVGNLLSLERLGVGESPRMELSRPHSGSPAFAFESDGELLEGAASISRQVPWALCVDVTL